jgi:hypothetical protein
LLELENTVGAVDWSMELDNSVGAGEWSWSCSRRIFLELENVAGDTYTNKSRLSFL